MGVEAAAVLVVDAVMSLALQWGASSPPSLGSRAVKGTGFNIDTRNEQNNFNPKKKEKLKIIKGRKKKRKKKKKREKIKKRRRRGYIK